jgi:protocatechuate 3,4-dioxygenase beta subunit
MFSLTATPGDAVATARGHAQQGAARLSLTASAVTLLAFASILASCASSPGIGPHLNGACVADDECASGQLCFAEGCVDPGKNVVVEVSGDAASQYFARDFAIEQGSLGTSRDFSLGAPLLLQGEFQREKSSAVDPTNRSFYSDAVVVRAQGTSLLIPGINRTFEQRFDKPERGYFQMPLGAGLFRVTAVPVDTAVPPASFDNVRLEPSGLNLANASVTFAFPAVEGAVSISGRLLLRFDGSKFPAVEEALTKSAVDLQAFDPLTREPLSQRFPVSSGQPGSRGDFSMTLSPKVKSLRSIILLASPREATALTPQKSFPVQIPLASSLMLEFGDYGEPAKVAGNVVGPQGQPVANAQVVLEGEVKGGGHFRSRTVSTDSDGRFEIVALANAPEKTFMLTVLPQAGDVASLTRVAVSLNRQGDRFELGEKTIRCGERTLVEGTVLQSNGAAALDVTIRAAEMPHEAQPHGLPLETAETVTGKDGSFALRLDPADFRLELSPRFLGPLASRFISVPSVGLTPPTPIHLREVVLSSGRRVSGVVRAAGASGEAPVPHAALRFFRVAGTPSVAVPLGSTVADGQGNYSLVVPGTE